MSGGGDEAGAGLAGLYSLVATCHADGVNPRRTSMKTLYDGVEPFTVISNPK